MMQYDIPTGVETLIGFNSLDRAQLEALVSDYGLAMDADDVEFCQNYFREEGREPTITELRVLDTYWSDHCRHTTFNTVIDSVRFEDELLQKTYEDYLSTRRDLGRTKPICLMDIATLAVRYLKAEGKLEKLDESEEINACTVKMTVDVDGNPESWLLLFKNETHNHPTEIDLLARRMISSIEGEEGEKHLDEYSDPKTERGQCLLKTICEKLGFDSLGYQSLDGLLEAIGIDRDKVCTYCWNGKE